MKWLALALLTLLAALAIVSVRRAEADVYEALGRTRDAAGLQ